MDSEFGSCDLVESMLRYGSSGPHNLPLDYLRNITNNFSDDRLLGEGGFGTVYKGLLPNGESIAVKKLNSSMPGVKDKQFENEAYHLMRLKHPNIVLLVGWCSETKDIYVEYNGKYVCAEKSERLLCLEYMPKGSLRGYLSDEYSGLDWETRYQIIEGICHGLHYLHEERQLNAPIIHMDLKPANILLDNTMVPKIADFGMSRLFSEEKTWTCTTSRDGTLGYMAPEYINRGVISTKSDIFSLGVMIIEIVTGQRDYPDESETGISSQEFTELVLKNWRDRPQKSLLEIDFQQIRRCIQIGLDCVKLDRLKRPAISQVIKMLHETESVDFSARREVNLLTNEVCQQQHGASMPEAPSGKSSRRIKRPHALARLELDRLVSLFPADSAANGFRIGRSGDGVGDLRLLCQSLLLSGPDEFAIPVAEWEAHKSMRSPSSARPIPIPDPFPALARPDVKRAGRPARGSGHQAAVSEDIKLGQSSDDCTYTSSTTTEFTFRPRTNWSWLRGALLGSGSVGKVYEAITDEGLFFAVKEVNLFDEGSNAKQYILQLEQEIAFLSQFEHENIVRYCGTDKEDSKLYVFLELVTQGSLASMYQKYDLLDTQVSTYTRQILNGLTYLHKRNIVHRDIKCANILVHGNGSVKLADFGLSKEILKFNAAKSCKGTVYWMAPEVVNPKKTYGSAADIWSLGCTVLEMLTRQVPYPDMEWTQALLRIGKGEAPSIPSALSKDARDFISQCVKPNPEDRPSASELLEHPFLNMPMRSPI